MQKKDVYKLTNPQKNIWNMEQYYKGTAINNICGSVLIKEDTDLKILAQAINKFIENNDSFRTRIKLIDSTPYQYFIDNKIYEFDILNFNNIDELTRYAKKMASKPFEIIETQLFDFKLFKLSNGYGGFIINAHHIISDAATFSMIGTEITSNYIKIMNNVEIPHKEYSYTEYIEAEQKYLSSPRFEKDMVFWNELYQNVPEIATIPSLKNNTDSIVSNRLEFEFDNKLFNKLNNFCKENKISMYNFLIAIYSIYIGKINNTENFSLGTPVLNRSNFAEKHTSGMFISTSLLKINTENNPTFAQFIHNIAKTSMSMLKHQKYDYKYILDDVRKNNSNIPNLYDIALSYQITKATDTSLAIPYEITWYATPYISNSMDIHFHDNNDAGSLLIEYDYQVCKYEKEDIMSLHNRILWIIKQVIKNPKININNVEIVTLDEKNTILYNFNNTSVKYPKNETIIQLFENQVAKNPNNIAVVFENQKITYRELNEKANSLANYLIDQNVGVEDIVGIFLDKSIESIVAIVAVLKAGGCYLPIDIAYPEDRVNYILKDSKVKILLSSRNTNKLHSIKTINIVNVDLDNNEIYSKYKTNNPNVITKFNNLAYIIYTSGSTGNPKGVMIENRGVVRLIKNQNYVDFEPKDKVLQAGTIAFDASTFEIWGALLNGLPLHIITKNVLLSPKKLKDYIDKNKITTTLITPSLVNKLCEENPLVFQNLKYLLTGGDVVSPKHINLIRSKSKKINVVSCYGPTENSVCSACFRVKKDYTNSIPIGGPIANSYCYVVSKAGMLQPIGVPGELWVGGDGIARGYLNREDLTREKFIDNPFGKGKIYKTGDVVKWLSDGTLDFLGRLDNQVKIRGFRIELGEINSKILEFPDVKDSYTLILEDNNKKSLCSYVIMKNSSSVKELKSFLKKNLAYYMVPSNIVIMDKLPLNVNGKVDRNALPKPKVQAKKRNVVLPRNKIDEKLIILLEKVLNIENISIDDNFFELGGDSLSAINLCSQIQNELNIQLYVRDILDFPVIKDLSDIIAKKNTTESHTIEHVSKSDFYNISSAQKRIYFASNVSGNKSIVYNTPGGVIFSGNIDIEKLQKCLQALINRHESLRTSFELNNEKIVQKITEKINFKLDILRNANFKDINTIFKDFVKPFNLELAPLFRAKLVTFTNNKSALFIDMHHIISDGTSLSIFIDELCKLYNGNDLPELNITYKDFAAYEKNMISSKKFQKAQEYWINQFKDEIPVLNMPTNFPRPAVQSFEGAIVKSSIDVETTKKIETISNKLGVTPYMILLSCYYILLEKYTSQEDIVIGTPITNREISQTSSLIGMFVNTLALKNHVSTNLTFTNFISNVRENLLEAYKYQAYPFDELVKELKIKRDTSRNPLFDTMFTYQNNGFTSIDFNGIKTEYYIPHTEISKFDLSMEAVPINNKIELSFEYATKLFDKHFIKHLSSHYLNILNYVLENVDTKIADIDMISKEEKHKILYEFNDTKTNFPKDKTVMELFENQVEKTPTAIAVECGDKHITYMELNKKANQLGRFLRKKGIGRNDLICIVATRSIEMMIGIYGIIKSGAAYVPIDPNYPKDRKNHILKDSSPKVVIVANANIETNLPKIDLCTENFNNIEDTNLNIINKPEDAVYCIYTSGTTGKPKGVVNKHIGLINRVIWMNNLYPIKSGDIILQKTTYCFDVSVWELVWWGFVGAKLSLLKVGGEKEPVEILKAIEKYKITTMHFVPSMLNMMLTYLESVENLESKLKTLKYVFTSGEELKKKHVELFYKLVKSVNPNVKLINVYGPTEASIDVTYYECKENNQLIPIGKPISNIQMYILDGMRLCGVGIIGEICIGGVGVAKGYLNREELTEEKFIDNPYSEGKIYRTGDLGRWLEDGNIEYIGRIDHQVKIRGQRIELDEIENFILKYPHIKNAVALKQTIKNRDFISSYYVADKRINIHDLRTYLSKYLPAYMVPSYFVALDDLPYSPNGKLDRKSLPLPSEVISVSKEQYVAPKTKLQMQLVNIWEKILNTEPIGINDNFFELGGDSLLAMNLNIELLKISNKISYADIFRFPTITELETLINSENNEPLFEKISSLSDNYVDILKNNKKKEKPVIWHPNNILLTGATGFLGIHILEEFIKNEHGKIYCIVRDEPNLTAQAKLQQKLNYYFGNKYDKLIDKRIIAITGNINNPGFGLNHSELLDLADKIDIVINSAANVAHFGNYNNFYNSNVKSVKHIIDFCKSFEKKLYHISTISVAGFDLDLSYLLYNKKHWLFKRKNNDVIFDESSLYIGQILENVYARSKFEAENYILNAISNGLDGYILRMGHLMPRNEDGVFQENVLDNDLINKIISFIKLGSIPEYLLKLPLEITPVDNAASAIYQLIIHPTQENRIFHLYNNHYILVKRLLKSLKQSGYSIEVLSDNKFKNKVNKILKDENSKKLLKNLLNDFDNDLHLDYTNDMIIKSNFTNKYLRKIKFNWHRISNKYLDNLVQLIRKVI